MRAGTAPEENPRRARTLPSGVFAKAGNARQDDEADLAAAIERGATRLAALQLPDGSWRGDYGGPMFLLPMYVAACHIAERPIEDGRRQGMADYLLSVQNEDGSVGLHAEDVGSMFATTLGYVALRLLGQPAGRPELLRMRAWMKDGGGALGSASWGKLVLALLDLYPYEGLHPILPELWILPYAVPFHPGKLWCHCRQVYLPMAWLYGQKARLRASGVLLELREELYGRPYAEIDFASQRDQLAPSDDRYPASWLLKLSQRAMNAYERHHPQGWRKRALATVADHIHYEDQVTGYVDIGPVNSVLNAIVHHFRTPGGAEVEQSFAALEQYLWESPEGLKINGYNSTALWDTAFAVQALAASPAASAQRDALHGGLRYIDDNQVREDPPDHQHYFRHASRGGWPFSDRGHGWPITDCTAEGLKSVVALESHLPQRIAEERLHDAVRLILSFQNRDGGWATYEKQRVGAWIELLNPAQVFGDIMADYSYVECTSACMQALVVAKERFPARFDQDIDRAVARGARFLRKKQRFDGGFQGSWAVCFTYGTWFGLWGLIAAGAGKSDPAVRRACSFLVRRQNEDGGWGEHPSSCYRDRYVSAPSTASQTSWGLLALARSGLADSEAARRAARFLVRRQEPDGDWPAEPMVGVFNRTTLINYDNYRRYFPIWALSELASAR